MQSRSFWIGIVLALLLSAPCTLGAAPLSLIDIIPNSFSGETDQNSEPNIAVNPSNVSQMIISVFANTDISPYFSTQNGGATWTNFQNLNFADTTVDWSSSGTAYMSRLFNLPQPNSIEVQGSLPSNNPPAFTPIAGSTYTVGQGFPDQPWIVTSRVGGTDRIYVGLNDLSVFPGKTATVRLSTDNGATWNNVVIERLTPGAGQDGPPIRLAASSDGSKVYGAFCAGRRLPILRVGSQTRTSQVTSLSSGTTLEPEISMRSELAGSMLREMSHFHSAAPLWERSD